MQLRWPKLYHVSCCNVCVFDNIFVQCVGVATPIFILIYFASLNFVNFNFHLNYTSCISRMEGSYDLRRSKQKEYKISNSFKLKIKNYVIYKLKVHNYNLSKAERKYIKNGALENHNVVEIESCKDKLNIYIDEGNHFMFAIDSNGNDILQKYEKKNFLELFKSVYRPLQTFHRLGGASAVIWHCIKKCFTVSWVNTKMRFICN